MKNCNEMVNSLFERREQYAAEQKRKRKVFTRAGTSMCCLCLVALVGFGLWKGGWVNSPSKIDDAYPGVKDTFDDNPAVQNKIIVHQVDCISADRQNISLSADDFVEMDKAALNEYYGINVFPAVPDDVREWEGQRFGIYRRNGGTGEVYWENTVVNYSNEDFSRSINVEIKKDDLPLCDYAFLEATEEKSIIHNAEVAIGHTDNGYYYAQFMYRDVGFQIIAEGLSQDEFVEVISSLIK